MTPDLIHVLVIEDNPGDARLVAEALSEINRPRFDVRLVARLSEAVASLREVPTDVVLLDLGLPDSSGLDSVRRLHAEVPSVPIVVLTISDNEALVGGAVRAGAQDYFVKGELDPRALARTLGYSIERQAMVLDLQIANERLEESVAQTRQALEETRLITERLKKLDQFKDDLLSIVSHDLRSPLTTITGFATHLGRKWESVDEERRLEFLEIIARNAKDMGDLVDDLLDVAGIESTSLSLEIAPFDLAAMVRRVANEMSVAHGRALTVAVGDACPLASGDEGRQQQILTNLISNAFKFSPPDVPVEVSVLPGESMLQVSVRDQGVGISKEDLPRIFGKFARIRPHGSPRRTGTGLGLYICRSFVEAQGGSISVESSVAQGSTFTYTVPAATAPGTGPDTGAGPRSARRGSDVRSSPE